MEFIANTGKERTVVQAADLKTGLVLALDNLIKQAKPDSAERFRLVRNRLV